MHGETLKFVICYMFRPTWAIIKELPFIQLAVLNDNSAGNNEPFMCI